MTIKELLKDYTTWMTEVVQLRLENKEKSREWVYRPIGYQLDLKLVEGYQEFFDRDDLNDQYVERFKNEDIPSKKPHAWLQSEVNAIYSFHKCFAMRNFTRLQYYRNDMSQKGKRNLTTINQTLAKFEHLKEITEKQPG